MPLQHGIVIVPGSGDNITKANCPPYLKSVVEPLINMKDELAKVWPRWSHNAAPRVVADIFKAV